MEKTDKHTLSVADFINRINSALTAHDARVRGEVTSIKKEYASMVYFTVKDEEENALLECVIWHTVYDRNGVDLEVGDRVIITGTPEIYMPRGKFSLKARTIEYIGDGSLKKEYEKLKKKLAAEGLFAPERKRNIPKCPQKIGVITSKAGVVMQDFTVNLGQYGFKVTMVNSRVEGKDAIHDILSAIHAIKKKDIEVLVIMRGGGSWESLQPFNTESVVRAVADMPCPVLTGIGHDTDITLSQMAADMGVSTPTAAAKHLCAYWDKVLPFITAAETNIMKSFRQSVSGMTESIGGNTTTVMRTYDRSVSGKARELSENTRRISSLFAGIREKIVRAGSVLQRSVGSMRSGIRSQSRHLKEMAQKLAHLSAEQITGTNEKFTEHWHCIISEQHKCVRKVRKTVEYLEKNIRLVNPENNLKLGYSISYVNGKVIRSAQDVNVGDTAEIRLSDGKLTSDIKKVE